jgi:hypothetical protein
MTTVSTPVWAPWTSFYDPTGQGTNLITKPAGDGLSATFWLDRLTLSLSGDQNAALAGATGLSGAVSVDIPADFNLMGFLIAVTGVIDATTRTEAVVNCSIGHSTQSWPWPPPATARSERPGSRANGGQELLTSSDFVLECFTTDDPPGTVGAPPYPPLPPLPITLSMQARRRTTDETIAITFQSFAVSLLGAS